MIRASAAGALAAALLFAASPAQAAGTDDIELVPRTADGDITTSFTVPADEDSLRWELVNLSDAPRTARVYGATAVRGAGGGVSVGGAGSARWLELPDTEITLEPKESRAFTTPLDVGRLPEGEPALGAVVLEAEQGSVTVRVATLVKVAPRSALPLPGWPVAAAVLAILASAVGLLVAAWRRRRQDKDEADADVLAPAPA